MKEDDDTNSITTITSLFHSINLNMPDLAIADAFKLGKNKGNRRSLSNSLLRDGLDSLSQSCLNLKNSNSPMIDPNMREREKERTTHTRRPSTKSGIGCQHQEKQIFCR